MSGKLWNQLNMLAAKLKTSVSPLSLKQKLWVLGRDFNDISISQEHKPY